MVDATFPGSAVVPVEVTPSDGATVDDVGAVSAIGAAVLAAGEGDGSFLYILLLRRPSLAKKPSFFSAVTGVDVVSTGESVVDFAAVVVPLVGLLVATGAAVVSVSVALSFFPNPRNDDMRREDPDCPPADGRTAGPSWCRAGASAPSKGFAPVGPWSVVTAPSEL